MSLRTLTDTISCCTTSQMMKQFGFAILQYFNGMRLPNPITAYKSIQHTISQGLNFLKLHYDVNAEQLLIFYFMLTIFYKQTTIMLTDST